MDSGFCAIVGCLWFWIFDFVCDCVVLHRLLLWVWAVLVGLQVLTLRFVWYFDVPFLGCLGDVGGGLFGFSWCMGCAGYGGSFLVFC